MISLSKIYCNWLLFIIFFAFPSGIFAQSGEIPLDPALLPIVVKIKTFSKLTKKPGTGTGFIVAREISNGTKTVRANFLVTNKHMVSDWSLSDGKILNFNEYIDVHFYKESSSGKSNPIRIKLYDKSGKPRDHDIHTHNEPLIDVAIIFLNRVLKDKKNIFLPAFDISYLRPFNAITSINFNIGSQVFVLGYPFGITSVIKNYPIAKFGFIASSPGETFALDLNTKDRAGKKCKAHLSGKLLIVDGLIMPGNSGGPVVIASVIKTRIDPKTKKFQHWTQPSNNQVIGILTGGFGSSGLSYSYCSDYIVETIDQFLLKEGFTAATTWP